MKYFVAAVAACIIAVITPIPVVAEAAGTPHIVVSGDVWLSDAEGVRLFMLPNTYYARINNLDENYYYVTFNGVSGKVNKNEVSTVGYHTQATGTLRDLTIAEEYSEFTAINLKTSPDLGAENAVAVPVTATVTFIGTYPTSSGMWYYVKYEQFYGYIRAERTETPEMIIPDFVPEPEPDTETSAPPSENEEDEGVLSALESRELQIVIIVGLAIPAIAIVVLLFRPRAGKREKYYED